MSFDVRTLRVRSTRPLFRGLGDATDDVNAQIGQVLGAAAAGLAAGPGTAVAPASTTPWLLYGAAAAGVWLLYRALT